MSKEEKTKKIKWEDIRNEVFRRIGKACEEVFEFVPKECKPHVAKLFITQIMENDSFCYYHALGICEEAKLRYRDDEVDEVDKDDDEVELEGIPDSAKEDYRCVENLTTTRGSKFTFTAGQVYKAAFNYDEDTYYLFADDGLYCVVSKDCFHKQFQSMK